MTMPSTWTFLLSLFVLLSFSLPVNASQFFTDEEKSQILAQGPWPPKASLDHTNRYSGNSQAIALGESLFNDKNLSSSGEFSCSSCHDKNKYFADGLKVAIAAGKNPRNTPSLVNSKFQRWFGWGGSVDTLWGVGLRAILNPLEMDSSADHVSQYISSNQKLTQQVKTLLPPDTQPTTADEHLVIIGKIIASFIETLVSKETPFDRFRQAIAEDDKDAMATYPLAAKRGLKFFLGRGRCTVCHFGPLFTNKEFADIGIPYFVKPGTVDKGRYQGIKDFKTSSFNRAGPYSDGKAGAQTLLTGRIKLQHRNWGEFRVPSLRSVADTAPYMHNGSVKSLTEVIDHYSELNEDRLHTDGIAILRSLNMSPTEKSDLVAFLKSLSAENPKGD
ncbi:MAG: cytochrome c peroxidase [Sneathiella sp.]